MSEQPKRSSTLAGINVEHDYRVRIPFNLIHDITTGQNTWNESCAKAIEMFGLPGDKYSWRFTKEYIEFWFREEKDAMMFELCCG
jgi:hypothetical protein